MRQGRTAHGTNGAGTNGADTDGANTQGANTQGANTQGANTQGANTQGASADGESADGESADGESADGASADGESADGAGHRRRVGGAREELGSVERGWREIAQTGDALVMLDLARAISCDVRTYRDLDVLDAAEQVADEINALIDANPRRLIHVKQLRDSTQSVCVNIREGFGRGEGRERNHKLRLARGEAEEAIGHLRANFTSGRIQGGVYWPLRNRLITIVKMINSLLDE